jgi:hypothetical protein
MLILCQLTYKEEKMMRILLMMALCSGILWTDSTFGVLQSEDMSADQSLTKKIESVKALIDSMSLDDIKAQIKLVSPKGTDPIDITNQHTDTVKGLLKDKADLIGFVGFLPPVCKFFDDKDESAIVSYLLSYGVARMFLSGMKGFADFLPDEFDEIKGVASYLDTILTETVEIDRYYKPISKRERRLSESNQSEVLTVVTRVSLVKAITSFLYYADNLGWHRAFQTFFNQVINNDDHKKIYTFFLGIYKRANTGRPNAPKSKDLVAYLLGDSAVITDGHLRILSITRNTLDQLKDDFAGFWQNMQEAAVDLIKNLE